MMTPDTLDLFARRRNSTVNTVHTWLLVAGSLFLLAVTAWAFGGVAGIIYALAFGGLLLLGGRRKRAGATRSRCSPSPSPR